jgi:hypothetical protein
LAVAKRWKLFDRAFGSDSGYKVDRRIRRPAPLPQNCLTDCAIGAGNDDLHVVSPNIRQGGAERAFPSR